MKATRLVWASVLVADLLLHASRNGVAAELAGPPENAQEILRYQLEQEVKSKLESQLRTAKHEFDRTVNSLGKLFYDKLLTKAGNTENDRRKVLDQLVEKVIERSGNRRNPEVNYQEDLRAVVETATEQLLQSQEKDVGALKEYVRRVVVRDLLEAVGITGMKQVAHLVNRSNVEGVLNKAHEKARQKLRGEIDKAKAQGLQIENCNELWRKILDEEYSKAAANWVLQRLSENWGVDLTNLDSDHTGTKSELGQNVDARTKQILDREASLNRFILGEVQQIFDKAAEAGLKDEELKAKLAELFETLRDTLGQQITAQEEKAVVDKVADQNQRPSPYQDSVAPQDQVAVAEPAGPAGTTNSPTLQTPNGPVSPPHGPPDASGQSPPRVAGAPFSPPIVDFLPGVAPLFRQKPFEFWFLIELRMRSQDSNDVIVAIHQVKQTPQGGTAGAADEIEKPNLMPPSSFAVGGFVIKEIEKAAKEIQNVMESVNGVNLCVDEAQARAVLASGANRTPPVQLNLKLTMRDRVFGLVWKDAVRMGVENAAKNDWTGVTIRFYDPSETGG